MSKVLITGSSGLIGNRLVQYLVNAGYSILGLDIREQVFTHPLYQHHICNILERDKVLGEFLQFNPEYVVHLAARIDLDEKENLNGYASNIDGVKNVVNAVQQTPSVRRTIYTSSQLVCKVGYVPHDEYDYCPNTLYGESKVLTEQIVRDADAGEITWCLVRPTTVWGPGMSTHYQRFFKMIKKGYYFHVGNNPLYKSYSYIGNIVYQYHQLLIADAKEINCRLFYLADYEPLDLCTWANKLQKEMGAAPIHTLPLWFAKSTATIGDGVGKIGFKRFPFNSFRLNNILTEYQFNLKDTHTVCGELPYSIDQGVEETVAWLNASVFTANIQ